MAALAEQIQRVTFESVAVAFVDQGYAVEQPTAAAEHQGTRLEVINVPSAQRGFVLLPPDWVTERSFAWMTRFRRLAHDYERLTEMLAGFPFITFTVLMAKHFINFMIQFE